MQMSRHERHSDGIYYQHSSKCNGRKSDGSCRCNPSYQATVWLARNNRRLKKVFPTVSQAKSWRAELVAASKHGGTLPTTSRLTVAQALDEYIDGMKSGAILNRSHRPYKPSVIRGYARSAERIKLELGGVRMTDLSRRDIKSFAAKLAAAGFGPSSVRNNIDPIRVICRKAFDDEIINHDPTTKLRLPPSNARRDRTVSPAEAEALVKSLETSDQAVWATALYVGLRRGELQELRWEDLELDRGIGRCSRAWDDEGKCLVATKTEAGVRMFPLVERVRQRLIKHKLATGRGGFDLVFGRSAVDRFVPTTVNRTARRAWDKAGLVSITLHEARHSAATLGSYAGLGDLELTHIMGHSSVNVTKDIYGHVREDQIVVVTQVLDAYLEAETSR